MSCVMLPSLSRWARLGLAVLAACGAAAPAAAPAESHVAVLSVDGLGAVELRAGPSCLPAKSAIRSLASAGSTARRVTGVLPTITYPSHATLATGALPSKHGVVDNGLRGIWFKNRSDIAIDTIWDAAGRAGKRVAIVTWPSTYGAKADWLVPEDLSNFSDPTQDVRAGSTPGLFDALAAATSKPALMPFLQPEAGASLDRMTGEFSAEIVRRHRPSLLLAHFLDYDHRMHYGVHSPEACKALERIDGWIAGIVEAYRAAGILERTTFFIVSDHGFRKVERNVSLFALLEAAGWSAEFPGLPIDKAMELKVAGGSVALYPPEGAAADWAARVRQRIGPAVRRTHGEAVRWMDADEAARMGGFPGAAAVLCAKPGHSFAVLAPSRREVFVDPVKYRGAHGYCPDEPSMDAVFVASGRGVRRGGAVDSLAMVDVAPTIAAFLGVKLPAATGKDRSARFRETP